MDLQKIKIDIINKIIPAESCFVIPLKLIDVGI